MSTGTIQSETSNDEERAVFKLLLDISTERDTLYEVMKEALSDARILLGFGDSSHEEFIKMHLIEPMKTAVAEFKKATGES